MEIGPLTQTPPSTARASVLVVEDDAAARDLLVTLLERRGFRVRQTESGDEAIALARAELPSLVLLDVKLPGMSGYEVCRELRAEFGDRLPIVFVSGARTEPYDRAVGLRLGADEYIVKPFAPDELLARIERLIGAAPGAPAAARRITSRLSPRELEVLTELAAGLLSKEIAQRHRLSVKTVSNHIQNILVKLDVHTRAQAVAVAFREGALTADDLAGARAERDRPEE